MTETKTIQYPTQEIIGKKKKIEYIILWMLQNNDYCGWGNFLDKRLSVSQSTLSTNLRKLINNNLISKTKINFSGKVRKVYKITIEGKKRFENLLMAKGTMDKQVNYPPEQYLELRSDDIYILNMLHNNSFCQWKDFLNAPLKINQTKLSKKLKFFISNDWVAKAGVDDSRFEVYKITEKGISKYIGLLKQFNLDRHSILNEETIRIQEILKNSKLIFNYLNIPSEDLKFRLLNYILSVEFEKITGISCSVDDFKKILYFIALNHPSEYPNYISPERFAKKYEIEIETLNFFLKEIVEKNQFSALFFKLNVKPNKIYYFQADEEIELRLRAIVENVIKKLRFLKIALKDQMDNASLLNIKEIVEMILNKVSGIIFNKALRSSLIHFLPSYIEHLKYMIEEQEISEKPQDKLKSLAFRDVPSISKRKRIESQLERSGIEDDVPIKSEIKFEFSTKPDKNLEYMEMVLEDLDIIIKNNPEEIKYYHKKVELLLKLKFYEEGLETIEKTIVLEKILETTEPKSVSYLLKAQVLSKLNKYREALDAINKAIEFTPDWHFYYHLKAEILRKLWRKDDALIAINKAIELSPEESTHWHVKAVILRSKRNDLEAIKSINKAMKLNPDWWGHYSTKVSIYLGMHKYKESLPIINKAIELDNKNSDLFYKKSRILRKLKDSRGALNTIDNAIKIDPEWINYYIFKIDILRDRNEWEKAFELANKLPTLFPDNKLAFGSILNLLQEKKQYLELLKLINEAIEKFPSNSIFYERKANILLKIKRKEEAVEFLGKAYELEQDFFYITDFAEELLDIEGIDAAINIVDKFLGQFDEDFDKSDCALAKSGLFLKVRNFSEALRFINKAIKFYPDSPYVFSDKAKIFFGMKKYNLAIKECKKSIQLDSSNYEAYYYYGKSLLKMNNFTKALEKFRKAAIIDIFNHIENHFYIGLCYNEIGNSKLALENFLICEMLAEENKNQKWIEKAKKYISDIKKEEKS